MTQVKFGDSIRHILATASKENLVIIIRVETLLSEWLVSFPRISKRGTLYYHTMTRTDLVVHECTLGKTKYATKKLVDIIDFVKECCTIQDGLRWAIVDPEDSSFEEVDMYDQDTPAYVELKYGHFQLQSPSY